MYVTRRLSELLKSPEIVAAKTDGPNSGYLVIQDDESVTYSCFGYCKNRRLKELPFPQNKELYVPYNTGYSEYDSKCPVFLIPVLNQPLSSNLYYAIARYGIHDGKAYTCSTEADKATGCFGRYIKDVKPRALDPHNVYQQFKIAPRIFQGSCCPIRGTFFATSTAKDGFPPFFLRGVSWTIHTRTRDNYKLDEAKGIDNKLRAQLPQQITTCEPLTVGKWYSPFVFINEGIVIALKDQEKRSMYYEITLEQRWEKVFACNSCVGKSVEIDVILDLEEVFIGENLRKAMWDEKAVDDGVIWFTSYDPNGKKTSVGMRVEIVERMKWEQKRGGFVGGEEKQEKISRVEEFQETGEWSEFGYYVLVERFNVKRMDGSLVLAYDFKHLHHMRTKWE